MAVVIPLKLVYTPVDATVTAIRNYQVPTTKHSPKPRRAVGRGRWSASGGLASTCEVRPSKSLETGGLLRYRATTAEMAADCV